jgi:hypothetical protein
MKEPLRPGTPISNLAHTVVSDVQQLKPTTLNAAALQAARLRAQASLARIKNSPLGRSPILPCYEEYIQLQLSRGGDPDEWIKQLAARAKQEAAKRRHITSFLSNALKLFSGPDKQRCIRTDLLQPARTGRLTSQQASDLLDKISGRDKDPYPFLSWCERYLGPLTIGLAVNAEGGAGLGCEGAEGISGLRHHCLCHFRSLSAGVGAYAEADLSLQLSASQGLPMAGLTFDVGLAFSAASGVSGEIAVSFKPTPHRPTLRELWFINYSFDGLAVSIGTGAGFEASATFGGTMSNMLLGVAS